MGMNCSYVYTDKTNGSKTPCNHPAYGKENVCVFHSAKVHEKIADFEMALATVLDHAVASRDPVDLNFKGFFFPKADFRHFVFHGDADFRAAVFAGDASFRNAKFLRQADFHTTNFQGGADFHAVVFASIARSLGTHFSGRATFNGCKFKGSSGTKQRVYKPVLSSRVPAEGNFGEGEHVNFTFADYLNEHASTSSPKSVIYVSYAWGEDTTPEGQRREDIVDLLCLKIKASGREIGRDKTHMRAGDSINRFAQEISKAERVVAVISEKSLRSEYCMVHELFSAFRRCNYDRADFQKKIIALEMDDAKNVLRDALSRSELARFWMNHHKARRATLAEIDPEHTKSPNEWAIVDAMGEMCPRLPDLLGAIKDIVKDEFREVLSLLP